MSIIKSTGQTDTEKRLAELCDQTFLKFWSYPNPFKSDGKELCDVIGIFDNHIFLFFDRESKKFENPDQDIVLQWTRWEKEVIEKQITTAEGAKRYILNTANKIYLDQKKEKPFPLSIPNNPIIHKIIVAHGAEEACKKHSPNNLYGSLGVIYSDNKFTRLTMPFVTYLENDDPVHLFDSYNLEIVLNELNTVYDFSTYLTIKEEAIKKYDTIVHCGEEDLLAHYFLNYDNKESKHYIGTKDPTINAIMIGEGEWHDFIQSETYKRRCEANKISEFWDELLQRTCQNAFDGSLTGNGNIFNSESAIYEMAKEPRFSRRALSDAMIKSIKSFPDIKNDLVTRNISYMPSFYKDTAYVFLQLRHPDKRKYNSNEYRKRRTALLEIACGAAKNKFPHLNKVIGIGIDAPKFTHTNAEDFILLDCSEWPNDVQNQFEKDNEIFRFFNSGTMKTQMKTVSEFPKKNHETHIPKIGRNDPCPCGSSKKFKKCCLLKM